jgi:thiamine biosynthesis lipoprotein
MNTTRRGLWCIFLCAASGLLHAAAAAQPEPAPVEQHYDGVLGTSMDLSVHAPDTARVEAAIDAAVREIARLDAILSTWREDSALMRLNRERSGSGLPRELIDVVTLCESWKERSSGIFSCRLNRVQKIWKDAQQSQQLPVAHDLLLLSRRINQATVEIDAASRSITLGDDVELEASALAKGYIIDKAVAVLRQELPDATAIKLDIGGDAYYWGAPPGAEGWQVAVADAALTADNGAFISNIALKDQGVATSGHTSRTFTIGKIAYSHIFDTRRGWPTSDGTYAVVTALDATTADALATILAAQSFNAAVKWAQDSLDEIQQVLLVSRQGQEWHTRGWIDLLHGEQKRQLRAEISLTMDYTIPPARQALYERPFVAIWVSDRQGKPMHNLLLLGGDERWARSNSAWWRRAGSGRLDTYNVTRPTRGPGEYQLIWDGKDDEGASLLEGEYQLNVEATSRYGGHDYVSQPFSIAPGTQRFANPGQGEVGPFRISVEVAPPQ